MLTPLNWIGALVLVPGEQFLNAQIVIRKDEVTVSSPAGVLAHKAGAVDVQSGPRDRVITFDDGTTWTATLPAAKGGCGCS